MTIIKYKNKFAVVEKKLFKKKVLSTHPNEITAQRWIDKNS